MTTTTDRSLYFEDLTEGLVFETKVGREVTDPMIRAFAEVTGDFNPIHIDDEWAKESAFGRRIAHGLLGLSMAAGFLHEMGIIERSIVAFTTLEWRFRGPTFVGDTLSCRLEVTRRKGLKGQGLVIFKSSLSNQRKEVIQEGVWSLMVKKRPA